MRKTVRQMLNQIDEFLAQGDVEAMQLWAILTALRGPDNQDYELKHNTTSVIRGAAFPVTRLQHNERGGILRASMVDGTPLALEKAKHITLWAAEDHFKDHANRAAHILSELP